jgi:beta-lactam-binding protein with PASTA domain
VSLRLLDALMELFLGPVSQSESGGRLPRKGEVPDVRSLDVDDARFALLTNGFRADIHRLEDHPAPEMGIVVSQSPEPEATWHRAKRVRLSVLHPSMDQDIEIDLDQDG